MNFTSERCTIIMALTLSSSETRGLDMLFKMNITRITIYKLEVYHVK